MERNVNQQGIIKINDELTIHSSAIRYAERSGKYTIVYFWKTQGEEIMSVLDKNKKLWSTIKKHVLMEYNHEGHTYIGNTLEPIKIGYRGKINGKHN